MQWRRSEEGEARRSFWNGDDGEERRRFCNGEEQKRERRDGGFEMEMMERRGGGIAMEKRERGVRQGFRIGREGRRAVTESKSKSIYPSINKATPH